jgi:hypothetical protein
VWCVINLTWPEDNGMKYRVMKLRDSGFEVQLRSLLDDSDLDVKDRVKTALEHFENERKMMDF